MKSAVLFFLATVFAVGVSFPVTDDAYEVGEPPFTNETEVDVPFTNLTEPLVENENDTDFSGDFFTTSQPSEEFSGSESEEEKLSVRSVTHDVPVVGESGSGFEGNFTEAGSAIHEIPVEEIEIEEEEELTTGEEVEGENEVEDDVPDVPGAEEGEGTTFTLIF